MLVLRAAQGRAQEGLMLLRSRADTFAQELQVNRLAEVFCELCPAASPGGPRLVERADDEHGDVPSRGLCAEDLADRKTVEVRQHHVEQDDIGQRRPGQVERLQAIERDEDFATLLRQIISDQFGKLRIVINGQNFRFHPKELGPAMWQMCVGRVKNRSQERRGAALRTPEAGARLCAWRPTRPGRSGRGLRMQAG